MTSKKSTSRSAKSWSRHRTSSPGSWSSSKCTAFCSLVCQVGDSPGDMALPASGQLTSSSLLSLLIPEKVTAILRSISGRAPDGVQVLLHPSFLRLLKFLALSLPAADLLTWLFIMQFFWIV
jgi:hypothetical protein